VVTLQGLNNANKSAQGISTGNVPSLQAIGLIDATLSQGQLDLANELISGQPATVAKFTQAWQQDQTDFTKYLQQYRNSGPAGSPAVISDLESRWNSLVALAPRLLALGNTNQSASWEQLRDAQITPAMTAAAADIDKLRTAESADADKQAASAKSSYTSSRLTAILLMIIGCLFALGLGFYVAQGIVRSLTRVKDVCTALASGDLTQSTNMTGSDEPGEMGRALDTALERLRDTVRTIDESANALSGAAEEMSGVSLTIAASAEEASVQADTVSNSTAQISHSVDAVSAGSEEMGSAIREISQSASEAARVAAEAVGLSATTSATMNKLGESSAEIGNVIKVITSIAEQTNLLALNATIEAARAGEAGKGFAVVANEVKDLAQETSKATEDISRRVEAIQADTGGAVTAIEEITEVIAKISDYQTTIASAVEEQTATTNEMTRSVAEAASGTNEIAANISGVAEAARATSEGVTQSQQATANLAQMSTSLRSLVATFRY
jgi:methyl-accepting chemotaxis protein